MGFGRDLDIGIPKTRMEDDVATVTTAGTDEVLTSTPTRVKKVTIQAQTDNTGAIAIGTSGVDATVATGTGNLLYAGESKTMEAEPDSYIELSEIYIDSTVSGEGVRYNYEY